MSALLVDELDLARIDRADGWRHVRGPEAAPRLVLVAGDAATAAIGPRAGRATCSGWQLTDRGVKVVLSLFLVLFAIAAVVLVGGFLAVSDAPIPAQGAGVIGATQG